MKMKLNKITMSETMQGFKRASQVKHFDKLSAFVVGAGVGVGVGVAPVVVGVGVLSVYHVGKNATKLLTIEAKKRYQNLIS